MKESKWILTMMAVSSVLVAGVCTSEAQEFYPAQVRAFTISTNSLGNLTYHYFNDRDIIRNCAHQMGITNLAGMSLVYDRSADALDVVSGTNQTIVCSPMVFSGGTSLSNTNGTLVQRLADVYYENSSQANGTLIARETLYTPTNGITYFKLRGQLQFAVPDNASNPPAIYLGSLTAGNDFLTPHEDWRRHESEDR